MLNWINKKRNKKGFTLVELVVVMAILGILAMIAIPKLGSSRDTAKKATHDANVRILKSAAAMYLADHPTAKDIELTDATNISKFMEYFDSKKLPKAYDDTDFKVTITDKGDITVFPDEKAYEPATPEPPTGG